MGNRPSIEPFRMGVLGLKGLLSLLLTPALILVLGIPAQAAPPPAGERGSFFIFGEYAPQAFHEENRLQFGVGWMVGENLALGLTAMIADNLQFGAFAGYTTGPLLAQGELRISDDGLCCRLAAFYRVEVEDFLLGVGLGTIHDAADGTATFFAANAGLSTETISLYVEGDYYVNGPDIAVLSLVVSYTF